MDLKSVVKKLQQFADPSLAESWDNVGLLVEPTPPHEVYPTLYVWLSWHLSNKLMNEIYGNLIRNCLRY